MPVSKAQIAATGKYERTAYDKVLLRIEKESDIKADAAEDNQGKVDKRKIRKPRNGNMPTKTQIERAAAQAEETLNGYILKAVKMRIEHEAPDILSPKDPLQDAADAIDGSNLIPGGGYEKPCKRSEAITNDPCINDIV